MLKNILCSLFYSDKLAHVQVVINCRYSVAQMCPREDELARYLGAPSLDDVMSQNELAIVVFIQRNCNPIFLE